MLGLGTTDRKTIPGHHIQPLLPMSIGLLGATVLDAGFIRHPRGAWCVQASVRMGPNETPYVLVLSLDQAREADIVDAL